MPSPSRIRAQVQAEPPIGNLAVPDESPPERKLRPGRALAILGRDALIALTVAALAELALQLVGEPGTRPGLFDADYTAGKPNAVNAQGFRGPEAPLSKPPGEFRLLALGDSTTFGTSVAWQEAWPERAKSALSGVLHRPVSAITAGIPAASLKNIDFAMNHGWGSLQADAVTLLASGNLVSLAWIGRDSPAVMPKNEGGQGSRAASRAQRFKDAVINRGFRYLKLPVLLMSLSERATYLMGLQNHTVNPDAPYGAMLAHGWRQPGLDPALAEEAWRVFERDLSTLRDRVRGQGARFLVASLPARFMLSSRASDNEKNVPLHRLSVVPGARILEICHRLGIDAIDLTTVLRQAETVEHAPLYVAGDYAHLSPLGHKVVANALAARLAAPLRLEQAASD